MKKIIKENFDLVKEILILNKNEKSNFFITNKSFFQNNNDINIEIGCGNGHFLNNIAIIEQNNNFIGIDIKLDRLIKSLKKQIKLNLTNIKWINGEASFLIENFFENESINKIYITFPDPWPKRRQHKKRLININLINIFYQKLKSDSEIFFITDYLEYYQYTLNLFLNSNKFYQINKEIEPVVLSSIFAQKFLKKDIKIHYFYLKKLII